MKQKSLALLICLFLSLGLFAQIEFVNFDLNNHNNSFILFQFYKRAIKGRKVKCLVQNYTAMKGKPRT